MKILINVHSAPFKKSSIVTGNSIRANTIGENLIENGFTVKYLIQKNFLKEGEKIKDEKFITYEGRLDFLEIVKSENPDLIYFIQGENLEFLKGEKIDSLIIGDFIAPSLVEYHFQELSFEEWFFKFITRISMCDYILCSTDRQKAYYLNLIMCSGFPLESNRIMTLPLSGKNIEVKNPLDGEITRIVMGGVLWPWIDSRRYLLKFVEEIERGNKKVEIKIFRGKYPFRIGSMKYSSIPEEVLKKGFVKVSDFLPYEKLLKEYLNSSLAFDLFERNIERELSFSFRNIDYLNCSLPIICPDFTSMSQLIEKYDAGWVVKTPNDLEKILKEMEDQKILRKKRKNAKKLFREKFDIDKNIVVLKKILKSGSKRKKKRNFIEIFGSFSDEIFEELAEFKEEIKKLKDEVNFLRKEKEELIEKFNEKDKDHTSSVSVIEEQKKYIAKLESDLKKMIEISSEKDVNLTKQENIIKEQKRIIEEMKKYSHDLEERIKNLTFENEELKKLLSKKLVKLSLKIEGILKRKKQ